MEGQIYASVTLLRMEAGQHVFQVVEGGHTGSPLPSHHLQPSLDGSGIQTSRTGLCLGESLEHPSLGSTLMAVSQVEPTLK